MMTDLEELERLHAGLPVLRAETWNHEDGEGHAAIIAVVDPEDWCEDEHPEAYNIAVNGVRLLNALPGLIAELRAAREALTKISAIRDSIVGLQGFNFSEQAYPLVAVLKAAGYEGVGYAIASANLGTLFQRIATLEAERDALREVAEAAREAVRSSIGLTPEATHRIATDLAKVPK